MEKGFSLKLLLPRRDIHPRSRNYSLIPPVGGLYYSSCHIIGAVAFWGAEVTFIVQLSM